MKEIYRGIGSSGTYDLRTLKQDKNIYLMDNHMAAAWCWGKELDQTKSYNILHIDKHYDLLPVSSEYVNLVEFDIFLMEIDEFIGLKNSSGKQVFRFDNYLTILDLMYPHLFKKKNFATPKEGSLPREWKLYESNIYDLSTGNLSNWINETDEK